VTGRNARSVIRNQKQVIRAQNILIDWLLEQVERERTRRLDGTQTRKEDSGGDHREGR
jgi:hypothetical protein